MAYFGPSLPGVAQPEVSNQTPSSQTLPDGMTAAQRAALAKKLAQQVINPQLAAAKSLLTAADRQAVNAEGAYRALADMRQRDQGQVQGAYQAAAGSTAAFSKGYSDAMQSKLAGSANDMNEFLRQMGAPAGQMVQPGAAGDVVYGLTGALPASGLAAQGAAAGAYAAQQPGNALAAGLAEAALLRGAGQTAYQSAVEKINAAAPGVVEKQLAALDKADAAAVKADLDEQREANRHAEAMARVRSASDRVRETRRHNKEMERIGARRAAADEMRAEKYGSGGGGGGGGGGGTTTATGGDGGFVTSSSAIASKTLTASQNASLGTNYQWGYVGSGKNKRAVVITDPKSGAPRPLPKAWEPKKAATDVGKLNRIALDAAQSLKSSKESFMYTREDAIVKVSAQVLFEHPEWSSTQVHAAAVKAVDMQDHNWQSSVSSPTVPPTSSGQPTETYKLGKTGIFVYTDPREATGNNTPGVKVQRKISPGDPEWADAVAKAIDPATMKPLTAKARQALLERG